MLVYVAVFIANVYCNINSLKVCVKCIKCLELWQKCLWLVRVLCCTVLAGVSPPGPPPSETFNSVVSVG